MAHSTGPENADVPRGLTVGKGATMQNISVSVLIRKKCQFLHNDSCTRNKCVPLCIWFTGTQGGSRHPMHLPEVQPEAADFSDCRVSEILGPENESPFMFD